MLVHFNFDYQYNSTYLNGNSILSGENQIGKVSKQYGGFLQEMFTTADNFAVNFPMDLDVKLKATLMAALFLIVNSIVDILLQINKKLFFRTSCSLKIKKMKMVFKDHVKFLQKFIKVHFLKYGL